MTLIEAKFKEHTSKISAAVSTQKDEFLGLSDAPYSKFQAIFNLEEIKERNKPTLAKQDIPKSPFFLFDLDKVMSGAAEGETLPDELLKQTFFTKDKDQ